MEHARTQERSKEYPHWLNEMRNDPPWEEDAKTPAEKVQEVTHPIGEDTGMAYVEEVLKQSDSQWGKTAGQGLKRLGVIFDVLTNYGKAW